jgi:hypothetical protein
MTRVLFCVLLLVAGCVATPPRPTPAPPTTPCLPPPEPEKITVRIPSDVDKLLQHVEVVSKLRGADLVGEYDLVRQQFKTDQDEFSRNKLALMLLIPYASFYDQSAAMNLLLPYVQDKNLQASTLRPFAVFVYNSVVERRRSDEALRGQLQKVLNEQRHADDGILQKLKDEHDRAELLQKKLDALLELERNLSGRDTNTPRKP